MSLCFEELRAANDSRARHPRFDDASGNWSLAEWTNAMCGEAGEAANIAKKIRRGDKQHPPEFYREGLAKELADVVIYADLVARAMGVRLEEAVRSKFNEVSERWNVPDRL